MANIYDDVATLQEQVAALQTTVTLHNARLVKVEALDGQTLVAGTDLNNLDCGRYIIPTVTVAQSLLNAPTAATNYTGMLEVYCGGSGGQKIQKYTICRKDEKLYFERCYYSNSWGTWKVFDSTDTGWTNISLASGVVSYADSQIPQCRKVGSTVFVRGAVKNVFGTGVLATLPSGYRPTATISFIQNTSLREGGFPMFSRFTINAAGEIKLEAISDGASFDESKWFPIHMCFEI